MRKPARRSARHKAQRARRSDHHDETAEDSDPLEDLTRPQLLKINHVFDSIVSGSSFNPASNNNTSTDDKPVNQIKALSTDPVGGGGFLCEDEQTFDGGGFIVDEDESAQENPEPGGFLTSDQECDDPRVEASVNSREFSVSAIRTPSFSKVSNRMNIRNIQHALKLLGLPYRDSEILQVCENAASSDGDDEDQNSFRRRGTTTTTKEKQKWISRINFSKVCAVLMMAEKPNDDDSEPESDDQQDRGTDNDERTDKIRQDDAEYHLDHSSQSDQASTASDYKPDNAQKKKPSTAPSTRRKTRQTSNLATSGLDDSDQPLSINNRQKGSKRRKYRGKKVQEDGEEGLDDEDVNEVSNEMHNSVLDTFSLFFETNSDVSDRTIGYAEVKSAADKLGEKLSDEEIQQMLTYASYTNNSRVTIHAFEKLMNDIKTV